MGIRGFENRLERAVDGTLSRLFHSDIEPVELGRKLQREMDAGRTVGVNGQVLAPNVFDFTISANDFEKFGDMIDTLQRDLTDAAREHAQDEGYGFVGPIRVTITPDDAVRKGMVNLNARFLEGQGERAPGHLLLPTGARVPLGEYVVTIGRQNDCTIVLADPNVSRHHAEVRPAANGFLVRDLDSTNGTRVNGERITEQVLQQGDELACGNTVMVFEAS